MLRRVLFASAGAVALVGSAFAADLPSRAPPPVYVPPAPIFTWTGVYVGGQIGYAFAKQNANYGDSVGGYSSFSQNTDGVIGGAHVGYNLQLNQFVVGLEGSVDGTSISKNAHLGLFGGADPAVSYNVSSDVQGSIRGRVGYAWDRVLIYATGGVAFAGTKINVSTPFSYDSASNSRVGWTVGGGVEYAVTNNWSIRAEYRYSDFGHPTFYPTNLSALEPGVYFQRQLKQNQVQAGFSYKFDLAPPPAPVVAKY